jgi:hypothetical protein
MYQMEISMVAGTGAKNGTISTPVGCPIPLLIN